MVAEGGKVISYGTIAKDRRQLSELGKGKETECPLKPPEEMQPCQHLDFILLTSKL